MSTIVTEIYDALREAGASEEKARKAAEVVANFDAKNSDVQHEFALLKGEFNTVKWMLGTNITLTLLVLGKLFLR
ncbi:integrase [Methylosinus sp. Ce-a6]|uniref:integrase n=1 Tax=Methylosinus sp. Ce-a6 TaxID=2172005 RepID=UPI00135AB47F|nr:integrase [Methylosinus sp. Ce-a6]